MIKRSIIFSVFIIFIWNIILQFHDFDEPTSFQNSHIHNDLKLEEAVSQFSANKPLLLGSSLMGPLGSCEGKMSNWGFAGKSNLLGLEVLQRLDVPPKKVFIEMNVNYRKTGNLVSRATRVTQNPILKNIKSLRTHNHIPSLLITNVVKTLKKEKKKSLKSYKKRDATYNKMVEDQVKVLNNLSPLVKSNINKVIKEAKNLIAKGADVYFISLPVDEKFFKTLSYKFYFDRLKESELQERHIHDFKQDYPTVDGLHMNKLTAQKFCEDELLSYL